MCLSLTCSYISTNRCLLARHPLLQTPGINVSTYSYVNVESTNAEQINACVTNVGGGNWKCRVFFCNLAVVSPYAFCLTAFSLETYKVALCYHRTKLLGYSDLSSDLSDVALFPLRPISAQEIRTKTSGSVKDRIGRAIDNSKIGVMDPQNRMIGLHLYEGHFKVIPMDAKGQLKDAFNIRLEELEVLDIKFLSGFSKPTIAVLYQDQRHARHIKTYAVNVRDKEFVAGPWAQCNVEHNASELIPVPEPFGGVLILGHQTICYHSGTAFITVPIQNTSMCAYGWVDADGSRLLISDHFGGLHLVILTPGAAPSVVQTAHIEALGETSCASSISYLDNGVVFIGSAFGDSQLIKLNPEKDAQGTYIEVLETFDNLGPIMDMCVADLDRQGQGQAVTCSGCNKDGSLRIIRNGIGINDHAAIELAGIKNMWSLRPSSAQHDKYLVQAFISETRVLAFEEDEDGDHQLAEGEIAGFQQGCTLFCGCVCGDLLVQVTERGVVLIACDTLQAIDKWDPPTDLNITVASGNLTRVVLALGGGNLVHLEVCVATKKVSQVAGSVRV